MKMAVTRYFKVVALLSIILASCSPYKYGSVDDEFTVKESPQIAMDRAKKWFKASEGRIVQTTDDSFLGKIPIELSSWHAAICELKYQQDFSKDGVRVSIKTGIIDVVHKGNVIISDEGAVEKEARGKVDKLINSSMISYIESGKYE